MNFEETLQYLLSLGHETIAIKLGLRNTELLLEALGNPHLSFESVQISGTNGKGSTAVMLESICRSAGIATGLYTSPHLVSIAERIKINGAEISERDFAKYATQVRAAAEGLLAARKLETLPTFFEHVTAIALLAFREAGIALAILETGLGGRLDATTVAGARTIAITPLALDHQEYLGDTLTEIAAEKAAIIRPGVTAVIAPQPPEALKVILSRCADTNVTPDLDQGGTRIEGVTNDGRFRVSFETKNGRYDNALVGLRGRHQITNASVAIRLAESLEKRGFPVPKAAVVEGLKQARHAGRLELFPGAPAILLDGAHNPSGAEALRDFLNEFAAAPITLVVGAMKDKTLEEIAEILFPLADFLVLTQPDNPRAASLDELAQLASRLIPVEKIVAAGPVRKALELAQDLTPAGGTICVTGSLYLLGEAMALIKRPSIVR